MSRYRLLDGFVMWVATMLLLSSPLLGDVTGTIRGTVAASSLSFTRVSVVDSADRLHSHKTPAILPGTARVNITSIVPSPFDAGILEIATTSGNGFSPESVNSNSALLVDWFLSVRVSI